MADGIDIVIRDRINSNIRKKIRDIGTAADTAYAKIEKLKKALNFGGLNLGLKNAGIGNADVAIKKLEKAYSDAAAAASKASSAAASSWKAQETALNSVIAAEQKLTTSIVQGGERQKQAILKTTQSQIDKKTKIITSEQQIVQAIAKTQLANERVAQAMQRSAVSQEQALNRLIIGEQKVKQAVEATARSVISTQKSKASAIAAQERALNSLITSEEKLTTSMIQESAKRQQARTREALAIKTANNQAKISHEQLFQAGQRSNAARIASEQRIQREKQKTLDVTRRLHQAEKSRERITARKESASFDKINASRDAAVTAANNRIIESTNKLIQKEQSLVAALDRSSVGFKKMADAGLAAEAANNRLVASQERLRKNPNVTALNNTKLTMSEVGAAVKANRLAESNNIAAESAIRLKKAEIDLAMALDRQSKAAERAANANKKLDNITLTKSDSQLKRLNSSIASLEARAVKAARTFRTVFGAAFVASFAGDALEKLDAPQNVENKIRPAADVFNADGTKDAIASQERLNELVNQLYDIANRARVPVGELATSFRRFDTALESVGSSQQESLEITETIAKALTLSGSSASEAGSSLLQLSQAFNKGKLDGDEFRSVAENMPMILDSISKTLGISRNELFDYSEQGKITSQVLKESFKDMKSEVDRDFADLPKTIGQSLSQLGNAVSRAFGQLDQRTGITDRIIAIIDGISARLPELTRAATAAGIALGSLAVIGSIGAILGSLASGTGIFIGLAAAVGYFADDIEVSSDGLVTLNDRFKTTINRITEYADKLTFGEDATGKFEKKISIAVQAMSVGWRELQRMAAESLATIQASFSEDSQFGDQTSNFFGGIRNSLIDFTNEGIEIIQGFIDKVLQMFERLSKSIAEAFTAPLKNFGQKAIDLGIPGGGLLKGAATGLGAGLSNVNFDEVRNEIEKISSVARQANVNSKYKPIEIEDPAKVKARVEEAGRIAREAEKQRQNEVLQRERREAEERRKTEAKLEPGNLEALRKENADKLTEALRLANEESDKAVTKSKEISYNFEGAVRQVRAIQEGLSGINASGFQDLLALQKQQGDQQIIQSVGNNPQAAYDQGIFTEEFIQRAQQAATSIGAAQTAVANYANATTQAGTAIASYANASQQATTTVTGAATSATTATTSIQSVGAAAVTATSGLGQVGTTATTAFTGLGAAAQAAGQGIGTGIGTGASAANAAIAEIKPGGIPEVGIAAQSAGQQMGSSFSEGASTATSAIESLKSSAVSNFQAIESAAKSAAAAAASVGNGGGGGGGGLLGFSKGGYTGNIATNRIAGVVHGQEYVMPADATKKYRPLLEAMRSGKSLGSVPTGGKSNKGGNGTINVTVQNYGNSQIQVQQLSSTDIRIIAREEALTAVRRDVPKAVAGELRNPNSRVSKSLRENTQTKRRR